MAAARLFAIHVLTASGGAFALLALLAAVDHAWPRMFAWLGFALVVDAIDGPLARRVDLAAALPRWSGDVLDLVVDFVTYVFVPAYAIAASELLPSLLGPAAGIIVVITGAVYFADRRMKTADNYFRGFPALWNLAAFYLLLLRPPPAVALIAVAALAGLTFAPVPFVHPLRVVRLRSLNLVLVGVWAALALAAVAYDLSPGPWVVVALCAIGAYALGAGLFRHRR